MDANPWDSINRHDYVGNRCEFKEKSGEKKKTDERRGSNNRRARGMREDRLKTRAHKLRVYQCQTN